jgi:hypothetical protein
MADLEGLREHVYRLIQHNDGAGRPVSMNGLHRRVERCFPEGEAPSKNTLISWFGAPTPARPPSPRLLECIPALAEVLGVDEVELYRVAGVLPNETIGGMALSRAAEQFRSAFQLADAALRDVGLADAGEALLLNRLLQQVTTDPGLDYRIEVWPVVRGSSLLLHSRSWVILKPVERDPERQRRRTRDLERRTREERCRVIRSEIIGEGLWRSLGLRWRYPPPLEYSGNELPALFIEVPVQERNRQPTFDERRSPAVRPSRILALSGLWSHGETLVALVADALGWGTYDLRYQGFEDGGPDGAVEREQKIRFCRSKLAETLPYYAWAIPEHAEIVRAIATDALAASDHHLVVWTTYGPAMTATAARAWLTDEASVLAAQDEASGLVRQINTTHPVIHVDLADDDVCYVDSGTNALAVDRNRLTDRIRYSAARVLNLLRKHCLGPPLETWGYHFADLRQGLERDPAVPDGATSVTWLEPGTLAAHRPAG